MNWLDLGYTFLGSANIIFHFIFIVTIVTQEKKKKKNIHGFKCIHAKLFFLKKKCTRYMLARFTFGGDSFLLKQHVMF